MHSYWPPTVFLLLSWRSFIKSGQHREISFNHYAFLWHLHQTVMAKKAQNLIYFLLGALRGPQILLPQRSRASCPLPSVSLLVLSFFSLSLSLCIYLPLTPFVWQWFDQTKPNRVSLKQGDCQRWFFNLTARTQWVWASQAKFPSL